MTGVTGEGRNTTPRDDLEALAETLRTSPGWDARSSKALARSVIAAGWTAAPVVDAHTADMQARIEAACDRLWRVSQHDRMVIHLAGEIQEAVTDLRAAVASPDDTQGQR